MRRYELSHAGTPDSAGPVLCSYPGLSASSAPELDDLLSAYDYVPIIASLSFPDLDVCGLYTSLAPGCPSVLFESMGAGYHSRYSIIAYDANLTNSLYCPNPPQKYTDPLAAFLHSVRVPPLDFPHYYGGLICAWAYEAGLTWMSLPHRPAGPMSAFPDVFYFVPLKVLVYDHQTEVLTAICWIPNSQPTGQRFARALSDLRKMLSAARSVSSLSQADRTLPSNPDITSRFRASMSPEHYEHLVGITQEHIRCGDIFQAVLSQRWEFVGQADNWKVYQNLRYLNPSPYMFYLQAPDFTLIGASPETQLRIERGTITVCPIAGTCHLSGNPDLDNAERRALRLNEKEQAEHLMLVDLARNDVGRVSVAASVQVPQFMITESYSHVAHLVSEVSGRIKPDLDAIDAFRACFPAGTLSGAPKRKAMEIINQLEAENRGIYGGAVGYVNFNGDLDSGIAIRTIINYKGVFYLQSGAGIVADSDPRKEYEETLGKARALMLALLMAEGQQ